jgi:hypothetical protein
MPTTPLWFTAVIAGLGIMASGATAILTQRSADRREDVRWNRELQREVELRRLDALAGLTERRKAAYLDFLKGWEEKFNAILGVKQAAAENAAPPIHMNSFYPCLVDVQIFGTRRAAALATTAFEAMSTWSHSSTTGDIGDLSTMDQLRKANAGGPGRTGLNHERFRIARDDQEVVVCGMGTCRHAQGCPPR